VLLQSRMLSGLVALVVAALPALSVSAAEPGTPPVLRLAVGWDRDLNPAAPTEAAAPRRGYVDKIDVSENFRIETRQRGSGDTLDAGWHYGLTPQTAFSAGVGSDTSDVRLNLGIRHSFDWSGAIGGLSR
jgi:hypothetical protein